MLNQSMDLQLTQEWSIYRANHWLAVPQKSYRHAIERAEVDEVHCAIKWVDTPGWALARDKIVLGAAFAV